MLESLHHIAVLCSDRMAALRFYRDALGFSLREAHPRPYRGDEILFLDGYGITLELFIDPRRPARPTEPEALGLRHLAFLVSDLTDSVERLAAYGFPAEPIRTDSFNGARMTFVKDPDGLPIELHE
ncbi:MAG: VOC family protein [Eubacteriales bacterium]|nr:VOC family protein [Eubacteriales bacterium]